jgi:predicted SAM-dependent methyltransferase
MKNIKSLVHRLLKMRGYEIRKIGIPDPRLDVYSGTYHQDALSHRRFYNIGAGNFSHPYWTNIDYDNEWYKSNRGYTLKGIQHDLSSNASIPIKDNSAEVAYTSHTIEHLADESASKLFAEVYRFLKPGGYFRIVAPDAMLAYEAYLRNDRHFFTWINDYSAPAVMEKMALAKRHTEASLEQVLAYHIGSAASELHADSPCEKFSDEELDRLIKNSDFENAMNAIIARVSMEVQRKYFGNHCNWWTYDKTAKVLKVAGFNKIYRSAYLQSKVAILRNHDFFDGTVPSVSYFAECQKT